MKEEEEEEGANEEDDEGVKEGEEEEGIKEEEDNGVCLGANTIPFAVARDSSPFAYVDVTLSLKRISLSMDRMSGWMIWCARQDMSVRMAELDTGTGRGSE